MMGILTRFFKIDSTIQQLNLDVDELSSSEMEPEGDILDELISDLTDDEVKKDIQNNTYNKPEISEIYKIITDTRKFEIDNFWKRTLFFWGTIAILIAGYFNSKNFEKYLVFISYMGFFYNLIFSLSVRGSKFWQEHWEITASSYEKNLGFKVFIWKSATKIKEKNKNVFFLLRPYRFSVSKLTMILSDLTLVFWVLLIVKDICFSNQNSLIHFEFSKHSVIDWYTVAIVLIPMISVIYIGKFLYDTSRENK